MTEIVNLRRARKAKARIEAAAKAAANRASFGRTRAECDMQRAESARINRLLDNASLED